MKTVLPARQAGDAEAQRERYHVGQEQPGTIESLAGGIVETGK
jgi:hypothetical protein